MLASSYKSPCYAMNICHPILNTDWQIKEVQGGVNLQVISEGRTGRKALGINLPIYGLVNPLVIRGHLT